MLFLKRDIKKAHMKRSRLRKEFLKHRFSTNEITYNNSETTLCRGSLSEKCLVRTEISTQGRAGTS